jgi:hypothetical protein
MSIAKAQAQALAEGFLDSLGSSDKSGLRPKETLSELIVLAGELIEDAQKNLNASNANHTGKLSESLIAGEPVQNGTAVELDIMMNFYGQFVNKGVKGTKAGSSTAGYSFKHDIPSTSMVQAMASYLKGAASRVSNADVKKYGAHKRGEKKNLSLSKIDSAFAMARSIKQHGIKPTGFLDKAIATTRNKISDRLGAALRIDIISSITPII